MNTEFNDFFVDEIVSLFREELRQGDPMRAPGCENLLRICIASSVMHRLERIARAVEALAPDDGT